MVYKMDCIVLFVTYSILICTTVISQQNLAPIKIGVVGDVKPSWTTLFPTLELISVNLHNGTSDCRSIQGLQLLIGPSDIVDCYQLQKLSVITATPVLYTTHCPATSTAIQIVPDQYQILHIINDIMQMLRWGGVAIITKKPASSVAATLMQSLAREGKLLYYWEGMDLKQGLQHFMNKSVHNIIVASYDVNEFLEAVSVVDLTRSVSYIFTSLMNEESLDNVKWKNLRNKPTLEQNMYVLTYPTHSMSLESSSLVLDALSVAEKSLVTSSWWKHDPCKPNWKNSKKFINSINNVNINGFTGRISIEGGKRKLYSVNIKHILFHEREAAVVKDVGKWSEATRLQSRTKRSVTKEIVVTTVLQEPYMMRVADNATKGNDQFQGFLKDLLDMIVDKLKWKYTLRTVRDGKWGSYNPDTNRWNGMIGELLYNEADMAAASLTHTSRRNEVVDFTKPFIVTGLAIIYQRPRSTLQGSFLFFSAFSDSLWLCLVAAWIFISLALYLLQRILSDVEEEILSIPACFWYMMSTMFFRSSGTAPDSHSVRGLQFLWWWFSLLFMVFYFSWTTMDYLYMYTRAPRTLMTAEDLINSGMDYGTFQYGSTFTFFQESQIEVYMRMGKMLKKRPQLNTKTVKEGIDRVLNSPGNYAFILEETDADYAVNRYCQLVKIPTRIHTRSFGMALQKNSEDTNAVSHAILELEESGAIESLYNKWWKANDFCGRDITNVGRSILSVHSVAGILIIFAAGVVVCVAAGFGEKFYNRFRGEKKGITKVDETDELKEEANVDVGKEFKQLKERESESLEEIQTT